MCALSFVPQESGNRSAGVRTQIIQGLKNAFTYLHRAAHYCHVLPATKEDLSPPSVHSVCPAQSFTIVFEPLYDLRPSDGRVIIMAPGFICRKDDSAKHLCAKQNYIKPSRWSKKELKQVSEMVIAKRNGIKYIKDKRNRENNDVGKGGRIARDSR